MNLSNRFFIDRDIKYLSAKIPIAEYQLPRKKHQLKMQKIRRDKMNKLNPLRLLLNRDIVELEAWIELHENLLPDWKKKLETLKSRKQHDR